MSYIFEEMFKILNNKIFRRNLLFSLITLFLLFVFWLKWLDIYTDHNTFIKVPNFSGVHINDLDSLVSSYSLRYEIIDSVFYKSDPRGIVVNQDPLPDVNVKKNRKIYLTINSLRAIKVTFPDVFDLTLRQAVNKIQKNGLNVGKLEYKADIAINKVLAFKINGIEIKVGQELYHGTTIDLVVGKGLGNEKVLVPNLIGLDRKEANTMLKSSSLNIGLEYFKNEISDSNSAVVYKQYPLANKNNEIKIGSFIDLYFEFVEKKDSL